MTSEPTEYEKNTKEQYESLGRFVEAFELMVHEARISCIDLISLDGSKRIKRMDEIAFYHQSLTAKPLFEMFRATMMETVTDPDFRKKHEISDIDCEYFAGVFTAASAEYNDLVNKRNKSAPRYLIYWIPKRGGRAFVYVPCSQGRSYQDQAFLCGADRARRTVFSSNCDGC